MSPTVPTQHPAVVLRSQYVHLRALLAAALVAVVGLSGAVVIVASDDSDTPAVNSSPAQVSAPATEPGVRYDGGPEEGSRGISSGDPTTRFDGGPEEGTRGIGH